MKFIPEPQKSDWAGIVSSVICIIHCMALPVIMSFAGITLADEEAFHWLDYVFVGIAALAVLGSLRQANSQLLRFTFVISWIFFAGSVLLKDVIPFAHFLMYAGSTMLIIAHAINLRQCRNCKVNTPHALHQENSNSMAA